jgi:hypothetical protein
MLAIPLAMAFNSCSSTKVTSDLDKTVDFTKYKTYEYYGWADGSEKLISSFDQERVESSFGIEFSKRGLTFKDKGTGGDLIITLYIITQQKTQTTATTTGMGMSMGGYGGYGYGYGGYGPGYGWGGGTSHTTYSNTDYTVGTLVIAAYDAKDQKLIWEAVANGTINEKSKGRDQRIQQVAAKMMLQYPVQTIKTKKK